MMMMPMVMPTFLVMNMLFFLVMMLVVPVIVSTARMVNMLMVVVPAVGIVMMLTGRGVLLVRAVLALPVAAATAHLLLLTKHFINYCLLRLVGHLVTGDKLKCLLGQEAIDFLPLLLH